MCRVMAIIFTGSIALLMGEASYTEPLSSTAFTVTTAAPHHTITNTEANTAAFWSACRRAMVGGRRRVTLQLLRVHAKGRLH